MTIPIMPLITNLTFPLVRNPSFASIVQEAYSGRRSGLATRSNVRWQYQVTWQVLRSGAFQGASWTEVQQLAGFFNSVGGKANVWAYPDLTDNAVTAQSFGAGDGVTLAYQLLRTAGGFVEPVYLPTGVPAISIAGSVATPDVDYTIGATGLVTFTVAPANGAALTWAGGYNWLCRFDTDAMEFEQSMQPIWGVKKVAFSTEIL